MRFSIKWLAVGWYFPLVLSLFLLNCSLAYLLPLCVRAGSIPDVSCCANRPVGASLPLALGQRLVSLCGCSREVDFCSTAKKGKHAALYSPQEEHSALGRGVGPPLRSWVTSTL